MINFLKNILIRRSITYLLSFLKNGIISRKYILFSPVSNMVYSGNVKYLFEYLSSQKTENCYWYTNNTEIKRYLDQKHFKYISSSRPLHMIWVLLKTKIVFSDGDNYINTFELLHNFNTIKIYLGHGQGPKTTLEKNNPMNSEKDQIKRIHKFDLINIPSNDSMKFIGKDMYKLSDDKIINIGYPRCDQFYNNSTSENKDILNHLTNGQSNLNSKLILYTPTWRPYVQELPLLDMHGLSLTKFNDWLTMNNIFFLFTLHPHAKMKKNKFNQISNIIFIDTSVHPFFDVNELMLEADILLNDYSTTSVDFSILNKPQVFFMPDYDIYNEKKGFIGDYRSEMPGIEVNTYSDFIIQLQNILENSYQYINKYKQKSDNILYKYYNIKHSNSVVTYYDLIRDILKTRRGFK